VLIFEVVLIESMTNMQVSFRCKRTSLIGLCIKI
jgi:hypothetical protein